MVHIKKNEIDIFNGANCVSPPKMSSKFVPNFAKHEKNGFSTVQKHDIMLSNNNFQIVEKQNTDLSKNKHYYVLNPSDIIFNKLNRMIFVSRELIFK